MKFYIAMFEMDETKIKEQQANHIFSAMTELKTALTPGGKLAYYEVKSESQYRKAERELKENLK